MEPLFLSHWRLANNRTAYTLDMYSGHSLDTCDILPRYSTHIRCIFNQYSTNIRPFRHSLVYFDFSTYKRYHMLIAQPLRPITNRIAVHFTFIPSFLPSSLSYHWRLRYFCLYHMDMNYSCDRLLK